MRNTVRTYNERLINLLIMSLIVILPGLIMTQYCGEAKHMDTGVQSEAMKRDGCYMDSSGSTNSRRARQGSFEPVRPPKRQNLQAGECWA